LRHLIAICIEPIIIDPILRTPEVTQMNNIFIVWMRAGISFFSRPEIFKGCMGTNYTPPLKSEYLSGTNLNITLPPVEMMTD
jgi:hypothetical protein